MPQPFPAGGLPAIGGEIEIYAPVETVWALVSDLKAMGRRSPETVRMFIAGAPQVGTRGFNVNRKGAVVWPTTTRITRWKPPQHDGSAALAFHVGPTDVEWSYELTPTESGTRLVERRSSSPRAGLTVRLVSRWLMGGAENHDVELVDGIERTLAAIKAEAEA
ncbi:SRPBCC family protein [Aeromicrobium sp. CTD01-1L150]|uniref:SRPBCC family protein n=1 Tax=Aeromicrobium sp. CTD01-1L150 TaxID=3341830 RepID=UPI0035BEC9F4